MLMQKRVALQNLIESRDGHHLTVYLANQLDGQSLKSQLNVAIHTCEEQLEPLLGPHDFYKFIKPVQDLAHDSGFLQNLKGNVGIFRNQDSYRVLKLPIQVEHFAGVATSYHVKPLLRWLQIDREFILFHLESRAFHIYQGSQFSLRRLENMPSLIHGRGSRADLQNTVSWLARKFAQLPAGSRPRIFVTGGKSLTQAFCKVLERQNDLNLENIRIFEPGKLGDIYFDIRRLLRQDAVRELEQAFIEYQCASEVHMIGSNLQEIARAAIQGQVRKLIVANGIHVFGKLNQKTGQISIHQGDLDHEDDDLLDDLAQMVLAKGGEVIIASQGEMPNGKVALAILQHEAEPLSLALAPTLLSNYSALASVN